MNRIPFAFLIFWTLVATSGEAQIKYLTIEPNHSTIGFDVSIAGGITRVNGKFLESDLALTYVDSDWTKSKVTFSIDAASIDTAIPGRDEHLRSADFFDVQQYPNITFTSDRIEKAGDKRYLATGVFQMHGIEKEIKIPFTETHNEGNTIGISIQTTINRIDYQVGHTFEHSSIPNFLSDDISVRIDFWTKRDKRKE